MFELPVSEVSVLPGGEGGGRAPPIMMAKKRRVKIAYACNQPSPVVSVGPQPMGHVAHMLSRLSPT